MKSTRNPARYWLMRSAASERSTPVATRERRFVLTGGCQAAVLALGLIPDLTNEALVALDPELDDDIDQEIEEVLDVSPGALAPCGTLLDEEDQLLEGELGARRMDARDRARVPGVDVTQVIKRLLGAQFRKQNAIGAHAKARLEELLRRHAREALIVLR